MLISRLSVFFFFRGGAYRRLGAAVSRGRWVWLLVLGALLIACQGEPRGAREAPDPADSSAEREAAQRSARRSTPRRPSLSAQRVSARAGNLLEADPFELSASAKHGGTLRRGIAQFFPEDFNWLTNNTIEVHNINAYVVEALARPHRDDPGRWAPLLAEAITMSEDGRRFTVHLKRGVRWQRPFKGSKSEGVVVTGDDLVDVTADDFLFSFNMMKDPRVRRGAHARSWYSDCEALDVIDDHTFTLTWSKAGFTARLWTMQFVPLPEHIYG